VASFAMVQPHEVPRHSLPFAFIAQSGFVEHSTH
jgi:hypothetical protein